MVRDELSLEPAEDALRVALGRRAVVRPVALGRDGRLPDLPRDAVEVRRAGKDGVPEDDEQHERPQAERRGRVPSPFVTSVVQNLLTFPRLCDLPQTITPAGAAWKRRRGTNGTRPFHALTAKDGTGLMPREADPRVDTPRRAPIEWPFSKGAGEPDL